MRLLAIAALVLASSACSTPSVLAIHSPVQPASGQAVTFRATADDSDGIASIEILEQVWTLSNCSNGAHCGVPGPTTSLHTCTFSNAQSRQSCSFTTAAGYPDGVIVAYRAETVDLDGQAGSDGWVYFAAGDYPWPDEPIPVYVRGDPHETIDLVFIPDVDFAGDDAAFVGDVSTLIANGFMTTNIWGRDIRRAPGRWNFYVTYRAGEALPAGAGCATPPSNWNQLRAIVDAGAIVHNDPMLRDCSFGPPGALFGATNQSRADMWSLVHETGHAVFGLSDEYCCNGGYAEIAPHGNVFPSQAACEASAAAHGWPLTDCSPIDPPPCSLGPAASTGWWRSDTGLDLMSCPHPRFGAGFGRADVERINWMYVEQCRSAAGC